MNLDFPLLIFLTLLLAALRSAAHSRVHGRGCMYKNGQNFVAGACIPGAVQLRVMDVMYAPLKIYSCPAAENAEQNNAALSRTRNAVAHVKGNTYLEYMFAFANAHNDNNRVRLPIIFDHHIRFVRIANVAGTVFMVTNYSCP